MQAMSIKILSAYSNCDYLHLLSANDVSIAEINKIFSIADKFANKRTDTLKNKTVALFFTLPSTRTRVSFSVAITQLGGAAVHIDQNSSQLKRGETIADTARMLSSYCDFIVVRTEEHKLLMDVAANSSVPVISALTMLEHPTQSLADMYTISKHKDLKKLQIAFVGDINQNTANSLMVVAAKLGAEIRLVAPKGCTPNKAYVSSAKRYSKVEVYNSLSEGLKGADIIYTDTFVSMGDEASASTRRKLYAPYQVNKKMLSYAKSDALVMHPLPAHRGEEITDDVIDGKRSIVWEQAKNKLVIAKALLIFLSENSKK
jgi:ornithine carbamoyltransferase